MTKLVIEEGGSQRAFKVGQGTLLVGSGASAGLVLTGSGVAEVHAELEIGPKGVVLRSKPGVLPPLVGGMPLKSELLLKHGQSVSIGSSKFSVEYEPGEGPLAGGMLTHPGSKPGGPVPRSSAQSAGSSARQAGPKTPQERVRAKHNPFANLGWIAGVLAIAAVGVFVAQKLLRRAPSSSMDFGPVLVEIERNLAEGDLEKARARLDSIAGRNMTPAETAKVDQYRQQLQSSNASGAQSLAHMGGNDFLDSQLKNFLQNYIGEKAERPQIRVFLKRCEEFRRRWPTHPEMEWVTRQERRFAGVVDLKSPPSFADIEFEVKALTWASPRQYSQAFAVLESFAAKASAADQAQAKALVEAKTKERKAWFDDRMQQARYDFEKNLLPKSVGTLFGVIVNVGDPSMADEAARQFVRFEDPGSWLRGYRKDAPENWDILAKNAVIAEYLAKHPL